MLQNYSIVTHIARLPPRSQHLSASAILLQSTDDNFIHTYRQINIVYSYNNNLKYAKRASFNEDVGFINILYGFTNIGQFPTHGLKVHAFDNM